MTFLNLETLLRPLSGAEPCGEAMDYDLDFLELETAARGNAGRQAENGAQIDEPPDWHEVSKLGLGLAERTKDLRIGIIMTRAAMGLGGYPGLQQGLDLLAGYVEGFWDRVHPCPDDQDGSDQTVRVNVLANLCDPEEFLHEVRRVPLTQSRRFGAFSFRDRLDSMRQLATADAPGAGKGGDIEGAFSDTDPVYLVRASAGLGGSIDALGRIDVAMRKHIEGPDVARLDVLTDLLGQIKQCIDDHHPAAAADAARAPEAEGAAASPSHDIRDRGDIVGQLDRICRWYRVNEPASPVPPLLERAMRLVSKDFMSLLLELAPAGAAQFRSLAGLPPDGSAGMP